MYCGKCGNVINLEEKFCSKCGAAVNTTIAAQPLNKPLSAKKTDPWIKIVIVTVSVLSVLFFSLVVVGSLIDTLNNYDYKGNWVCGVESQVDEGRYPYAFDIKDNNLYEWYTIDNRANATLSGTYKIAISEESESTDENIFYTISMTETKRNMNGSTTPMSDLVSYEFGIGNDGEAVLYRAQTGNLYICKKIK